MNKVRDILRLTIGPLHYEFQAHDEWGVDELLKLKKNILMADFAVSANRIMHLAHFPMSREENKQINQNWLPERYLRLLPEGSPRVDWRVGGEPAGYLTFWHAQTHHALFICKSISLGKLGPFQLPWSPILADIVARGGGIMHGGLFSLGCKSYILTAPTAGGKTTMINNLPMDWQVYSDDACLVWPGDGLKYLASPLPAWSLLLGRGELLNRIGKWQLGTVRSIAGIIFLKKSDHCHLAVLSKHQALPKLFQAFCEHPKVVEQLEQYKLLLFDFANNLTRTCLVMRLDVTLNVNFATIKGTLEG